MTKLAVSRAMNTLMWAAMRSCTLDYADHGYAHYSDEVQQADDLVALAARNLTRAIDKLPADQQPIGWTKTEASDG